MIRDGALGESFNYPQIYIRSPEWWRPNLEDWSMWSNAWRSISTYAIYVPAGRSVFVQGKGAPKTTFSQGVQRWGMYNIQAKTNSSTTSPQRSRLNRKFQTFLYFPLKIAKRTHSSDRRATQELPRVRLSHFPQHSESLCRFLSRPTHLAACIKCTKKCFHALEISENTAFLPERTFVKYTITNSKCAWRKFWFGCRSFDSRRSSPGRVPKTRGAFTICSPLCCSTPTLPITH